MGLVIGFWQTDGHYIFTVGFEVYFFIQFNQGNVVPGADHVRIFEFWMSENLQFTNYCINWKILNLNTHIKFYKTFYKTTSFWSFGQIVRTKYNIDFGHFIPVNWMETMGSGHNPLVVN